MKCIVTFILCAGVLFNAYSQFKTWEEVSPTFNNEPFTSKAIHLDDTDQFLIVHMKSDNDFLRNDYLQLELLDNNKNVIWAHHYSTVFLTAQFGGLVMRVTDVEYDANKFYISWLRTSGYDDFNIAGASSHSMITIIRWSDGLARTLSFLNSRINDLHLGGDMVYYTGHYLQDLMIGGILKNGNDVFQNTYQPNITGTTYTEGVEILPDGDEFLIGAYTHNPQQNLAFQATILSFDPVTTNISNYNIYPELHAEPDLVYYTDFYFKFLESIFSYQYEGPDICEGFLPRSFIAKSEHGLQITPLEFQNIIDPIIMEDLNEAGMIFRNASYATNSSLSVVFNNFKDNILGSDEMFSQLYKSPLDGWFIRADVNCDHSFRMPTFASPFRFTIVHSNHIWPNSISSIINNEDPRVFDIDLVGMITIDPTQPTSFNVLACPYMFEFKNEDEDCTPFIAQTEINAMYYEPEQHVTTKTVLNFEHDPTNHSFITPNVIELELCPNQENLDVGLSKMIQSPASQGAPANFVITPNPATNAILLRLDPPQELGTARTFEILDVRGKLIEQRQVEGSEMETVRVDISDYVDGMYFARIYHNDVLQRSARFVKTK